MVMNNLKTKRRSKSSAARDIYSLFYHYTPRTGHPDWSALQADARLLVETIRPKLELPVSPWIDRYRKMRAYITLFHNHSANCRMARTGRHDLWPLYFIWTTHRLCNFHCTYCDDHYGNKYPDLPNDGVLETKEVMRMLKIMRTRVPSILLAGGEPTLRRDLPIITRAARGLHYYPIIIDTNGSVIHRLLQKPNWRTWLADIDHLVVSLDALDVSVLSQMWCYKKPLNVIRNILVLHELSHEMSFELMISTVIQPGLIQHAREVLNLTNDLGICFCPMPVNVGPSIELSLLNDPSYHDLVKLILKRKQAGYRIAGSKRMNERMLTSQTLQCRNTVKPHIDFDGRLYWPCKGSVAIEPEMIRTLDFDDVDSMYEHASKLINPANFQKHCGARCNWSQHYSTDAYAYGLTNPWSLLSEIRDFLRAF